MSANVCPVCRGRHGGNCHVCPHRRQVELGKWRDAEFASTPCSGCVGCSSEPSHSGRSFVDIDRVRSLAAPAPRDEANAVADGMEAYAAFTRELMSLPPTTRDIVAYRFRHQAGEPGFSYAEIALRLGIEKQAVEQRHQRALDGSAALRALFAEKVARRSRS